MDGQTTRTEAEEALVRARRHAERLLDDARESLSAIFDHVAEVAGEIEATANADAELRLSGAGAQAERVVEDARRDARRIIERAQAEARDLLSSAQAEHQRLRERLPEISAALAAFEDRLASFYDSEAIDLRAIEAAVGHIDAVVDQGVQQLPNEEVPVEQSDAGAPAGTDGSMAVDDEADPAPEPSDPEPAPSPTGDARAVPGDGPQLPAPDGSGQPLAARATIAPTELADLRSAGHLASRDDGDELRETIYQRRGGGIKRRLREQQD